MPAMFVLMLTIASKGGYLTFILIFDQALNSFKFEM